MKRITLLLIILCTLLLLPVKNSSAQNLVSQAEVQFTPGEGPTKPVDPENPSTPGNGDGTDAEFALVSVTPLTFGSAEVSATEEQYETTTDHPNIQVVDLRGTGVGWRVSAKVSRFYDAAAAANTLPGAEIRIVSGRPISLSVTPAPEQLDNVRLPTDGSTETPVLKALEGSGMGQWVMRWYPQAATGEYVKLRVLAGTATTGSHTAQIEWILSQTP